MGVLQLGERHASDGGLVEGTRVRSFGDVSAELARVRGSVGLYDASGRDRWLASGDDRLDFVQGLATNDVEGLPVGGACEAAFITPKGKLVADARVVKLEDSLLFDVAAGRGVALAEHFAKYQLNEAFDFADVSEALVALELWGPAAAAVLGLEALAENATAVAEAGGESFVAAGTAFGAAAFVPAAVAGGVYAALLERAQALGGGRAGDDAVEVRRLELGLGRFGVDWDEATNPLEAGLDRMLHYKKGCYVGQEVVAKATYIGRVSRRLVRLSWDGAPVAAGTELTGGKTPGRVTSCAFDPIQGKTLGLGVVRHDQTAPGTTLRLGAEGPAVTVLGYPYRSKDKPV